MGIPQAGSKNLKVKTVLCDIYNGLNSVSPLALGGTQKQVAAKITWALAKLAAVGIEGTVLGCPADSESSNVLYPNQTTEGGPLNPPPKVYKNTGNNVYNKVYFTDAPTTPQCKHVFDP